MLRSESARVADIMMKAKCAMLWSRCLVLYLMLLACMVGVAWRHNTLGISTTTQETALAVPTGLVQRVGDRSVILHWDPVVDAHLAGYRVYRMESPRKNGPGQPVTRLTEAPIAATRFTDPVAGQVARRYWIVAVDALGQEGYPSAPTWYEREYKRFYTPFVDEWHQ